MPLPQHLLHGHTCASAIWTSAAIDIKRRTYTLLTGAISTDTHAVQIGARP